MCFSATASFTAGIVLTGIGIAALRKVQHPSQIMFAGIPLVFAVQQISEGVLWLLLPNPEYVWLQRCTMYFFLIFAQIVWPIWVSVSVLLLEKQKTRRNFQKIMVGIGVVVSAYLTYCLFNYNVTAKIDCYHIAYLQSYPETFRISGGFLYIVATILPPFFSHIRRMWMLGATVLISYLITLVFYDNYLVSVWCFFASVISISVWIIMREIKTETRVEIMKKLHLINIASKHKL